MGYSMFFHMLFAALGVGMPILLVVAEALYLRTGKEQYLKLAKTWGKATGLTFAIGAVSGTSLSFLLGLLWPEFMNFAGSTLGVAFALEGYAFFLEPIFLGLYLYGWDKISKTVHFLAGIGIAISGIASSVFVTATNAWMQNPVDVDILMANPHAMDPIKALLGNPHWPLMAIHSTLATICATAFAVVGIYAWGMLKGRNDETRQKALTIAMSVGLIAALTMPITGDLSAKAVHRHQPEKLAAMEAHFETTTRAPLIIGGIPDEESGEVKFAIEIPGGLSFLATGDFNAEIMGLDQVPRDEWPNVTLVHISFQMMVGVGMAMIVVGLFYFWARWKKPHLLSKRGVLWMLVLSAPLGYIGLEAGWMVSELGRQPWIIWKVMKTSEAVTHAEGLVISLIGFSSLYAVLGVVLVFLLSRLKHA